MGCAVIHIELQADVMLFDDPLSAMDMHVGRLVFENVFLGLLKDKTRIFVTNQLHLCQRCDRIYLLQGGGVAETGTYEDLMEAKGGVHQLMQHVTGGVEDSPYDSLERAASSPLNAMGGGMGLRRAGSGPLGRRTKSGELSILRTKSIELKMCNDLTRVCSHNSIVLFGFPTVSGFPTGSESCCRNYISICSERQSTKV
jgi:ABC-type multidrug transport system ATPase subunit